MLGLLCSFDDQLQLYKLPGRRETKLLADRESYLAMRIIFYRCRFFNGLYQYHHHSDHTKGDT